VSGSTGQFEARLLPAEPAAVAQARDLVGGILDDAGVEQAQRFEVLLVTSELVTNAVSHGSQPGDQIEITFRLDGRGLCICVRDAARMRTAPFALTPDETRPAGRGLSIVDRLTDWSERIVNGQREVCARMIV
jgi:anti-sigma regulatory factor (Ser/Thr protein kinase)